MREKNGQKLNDNFVFGPTITEKELKNEKRAKISFVLAILNSLVWLFAFIDPYGGGLYISIYQWTLRRSLKPGESGGLLVAKGADRQHGLRQIHPLNLWCGARGTRALFKPCPEAMAGAWGDAPRSSRPLFSGVAGDVFGVQHIHATHRVIPADLGQSGIDDMTDSRDGQAGLRDIGRHYDLSAAGGLHHPMLLVRRQAAVQG